MQITKTKLKQLIEEEIQKITETNNVGPGTSRDDVHPSSAKGPILEILDEIQGKINLQSDPPVFDDKVIEWLQPLINRARDLVTGIREDWEGDPEELKAAWKSRRMHK